MNARKANNIAKSIIVSIEEFMDKCPASTAKSAVKFWLCTNPNPKLNKARTKVSLPPQKAVKAADDLRKLLHPTDFIDLIKKNGIEFECKVMYKVYDHFYGKGHDDITPGHRKGSLFGGGFMLDLFKAKAKGNNIQRTW